MNGNKEITLEDLADDTTFFDDLKNGKFILVLGAGFSYGLPNKTGSTIPIAKEFVELTKTKFEKNIPEGNYNIAVDHWQEYIEEENIEDIEKENRFNEFKDLFLLNEELFELNKKLYSNILLPNWSRIYTFNFDNVLDTLISEEKEKYEVLFADAGSFSPAAKKGIGYLHNSILGAKRVSDLVFANTQYGRKILNKDNHLYYSLFNDIKTHTKNLIIIGSQFNEQTIYTYLFNEERGIRPDLKIININYSAEPPNYGSDIKKLIKETFWVNCTTSTFLDFLQRNKSKVRNISLEGSITINQEFIATTRKSQKFYKSTFYSAKQDDNCQWYGILNNYDVIRNIYPAIKEEVLKAFNKSTVSKVVAIVYGTGGCGKSTLLRRLALELVVESDYEIIWVKDRQLSYFISNALPSIQADIQTKYLVFLEDWYRLTADDTELGKSLLNSTQSISNIRLIIGDRDTTGKDYLLNMIDRNNLFSLMESENKKIVEEIISKNDDWKDLSADILRHSQLYNAPLFLILFAIVGINEQRIEKEDIDLNDLKNTVKRIAKYDLGKISERYKGLSKALHYWSSIYENSKIYISYTTFLKIADFYNGDNVISNYYKNWDADNYVLNKIRLYINVTPIEKIEKRYQAGNLIQFNHDKLAEEVLSKVTFQGWDAYDNIEKFKLLDVVIEHGDDYSASNVLDAFLQNEGQIFISDQDRKRYIDRLFYEKKNRNPNYLRHLTKMNMSSIELLVYIDYSRNEGLYPTMLWLEYFKVGNDNEKLTMSKWILTCEDLIKIPFEIVVVALKQPGNEEEKQAAVNKILTHEELLKINPHIVTAALKQLGNDEEKETAVNKILTHQNLLNFNPHLITVAFVQSGRESDKLPAANHILNNKERLNLHPSIVTAALKFLQDPKARSKSSNRRNPSKNIKRDVSKTLSIEQLISEIEIQIESMLPLSVDELLNYPVQTILSFFKQPGNEEKKQAFAQAILTSTSILSLEYSILVAAFKQSYNEEEKIVAAKQILSYPNLLSLQFEVVVAAFKQEGNQVEKQAAAFKILTHDKLLELRYVVIIPSFRQTGNLLEKEIAAKKILLNEDWHLDKNMFSVIEALGFYSKHKHSYQFVNNRIRMIIDDYHRKSKSSLNKNFYFGLINMPFHDNELWKKETMLIIDSWSWQNRRAISNVLHSYSSYPSVISKVCKAILENWQTEIGKPIYQAYGKVHYGDHIKTALGHPQLKLLALKTAFEIIEINNEDTIDIPDYLLITAQQIANKSVFPEWPKQ